MNQDPSGNRFITAILSTWAGVTDEGRAALKNVMPKLHCYLYPDGHYAIDFYATIWVMDMQAEPTPRILGSRFELPGVAMGNFKNDPLRFDGRGGLHHQTMLVTIDPVPGIESGLGWIHLSLDGSPVSSLPFDVIVHSKDPRRIEMPPVNRKNPTRAASSESTFSLMEFVRAYPDDESCLQSLWRNRYSPDGTNAQCPRCQEVRMFARYETKQQRQAWNCTHCGEYLYPTAGTIFHKSSTSLHLWFYAMYLMTSTRCGISAKQLERELGVTYKTAWRMAHRIRTYLMTTDGEPMGGTVEMDETYIGGRRSIKRGGRRGRPGPDSNKATVFGMVERQGNVMAVTVPNVKKATLMPHIQERVLPASIIYTDELRSYNPLAKAGYHHDRVSHSEHVYVSGDVHTNTIEGFWSLMKRGIDGVYHAVSAKHLQGYLNEYTWRYNHRSDERAQFETLLLRAARTPAP